MLPVAAGDHQTGHELSAPGVPLVLGHVRGAAHQRLIPARRKVGYVLREKAGIRLPIAPVEGRQPAASEVLQVHLSAPGPLPVAPASPPPAGAGTPALPAQRFRFSGTPWSGPSVLQSGAMVARA